MRLPVIQTLLVHLCTLISTSSFSQEISHPEKRYVQPNSALNNIERYKLDYELLDESLLGDSTILLDLDFNSMEQFRNDVHDMRAEDPNTKVGVLLYNRSRIKNTRPKISNSVSE